MAGFETLLAALPAAHDHTLDPAPAGPATPAAAGNDFDSVMQATLAPHARGSFGKGGPSPSHGSHPSHASPEAADLPSAASSPEPAKNSGTEKDSPAVTPTLPTGPEVMPLPIFLALPLQLSGPLFQPASAGPATSDSPTPGTISNAPASWGGSAVFSTNTSESGGNGHPAVALADSLVATLGAAPNPAPARTAASAPATGSQTAAGSDPAVKAPAGSPPTVAAPRLNAQYYQATTLPAAAPKTSPPPASDANSLPAADPAPDAALASNRPNMAGWIPSPLLADDSGGSEPATSELLSPLDTTAEVSPSSSGQVPENDQAADPTNPATQPFADAVLPVPFVAVPFSPAFPSGSVASASGVADSSNSAAGLDFSQPITAAASSSVSAGANGTPQPAPRAGTASKPNTVAVTGNWAAHATDLKLATPDTSTSAASATPPPGENKSMDTVAAQSAADSAVPDSLRAPQNSAPAFPPVAVDNAGTGVANMSLPMKNPQETNKVAEPDVKVLPVGGNGAASEKNLPPMFGGTARSADNHDAGPNSAFGQGSLPTTAATTTTELGDLDLPSLSDARMRALDRTHDMMALHSMRLVESRSDTLSVVIKPAVGTELSLELRQHGDAVEAQATLVRGDHQFLSDHWNELQQRLEQRGIKLAPLEGGADFMTGDQRQYQQPQPSDEERAQQASAFAEFAATNPAGGAAARLAAVHDGWESWA